MNSLELLGRPGWMTEVECVQDLERRFPLAWPWAWTLSFVSPNFLSVERKCWTGTKLPSSQGHHKICPGLGTKQALTECQLLFFPAKTSGN